MKEAPRNRSSINQFRIQMILSLIVVFLIGVASLSVGPIPADFPDLSSSITNYNPSSDAQFVLRELRLPRAILAGIVGAALATSGALMQGVTRNPLAGPSTMGLSTGGTFCLLVGILLNPQLTYWNAAVWSLSGAALGYVIVCAVALLSRSAMTPTAFALAGAVVSAIFGAITHGLTIYFSLHDELLFWSVGGIAHVSWNQVRFLAPICLVGLGTAIILAPAVTLLSLGEDIASGLGQRTRLVQGGTMLTVLLLTGAAIAVSGPVGFVGMMVPHLVRMFTGIDYRRVIPLSITLGASLTMLADVAARSFGGQEFPLGLFTTFVGAPFFVFLARRRTSARWIGE